MVKAIGQGRWGGPVRWAWWGVLAVVVVLNLVAERWEKGKVINADVVSYYSYLPAAFIYDDVSMYYCVANPYFGDKVWGVYWKDGLGPVQKYSMGMAVLYAPSFFIGHVHAHLGGWTPDGYTWPYRFWLQWSGCFYLLLGLWWLKKVLGLYYRPWVVALTLVGLALGTNLFYYSLGDPCMPHVGTFAMVSGLMWMSLRWHGKPSWGNALAVGLLAGLITLIRPNHVVFWCIPLLAGVVDRGSLVERWGFLKRQVLQLGMWVVLMGLLVLPQLLYWHYLTDRWVYYSYGKEGFFWGNLAWREVLFGFRKGWLVYTPLMGLAVTGWYWMWQYARAWVGVGPLLFLVVLVVTSAWWCWWYGGGFGHRAFIDVYPLLALGLGAVLEVAWERKMVRGVVLGVVVLCCVLNGFQTYQYQAGILHHDSMTARAWGKIFLRVEEPEGLEAVLVAPDYEDALEGGER